MNPELRKVMREIAREAWPGRLVIDVAIGAALFVIGVAVLERGRAERERSGVGPGDKDRVVRVP